MVGLAAAVVSSFFVGSSTTGLLLALFARGGLSWPRPGDSQVAVLRDPTYKVERLVAPAAAGVVLRVLAAIISSTGCLGQLIRRKLLNDNRVWRMRTLAAQIQKNGRTPLLLYPFQHLQPKQLAEHERLAAAAERVNKRPCQYNSVQDYHEAFKSQRATPMQVLERSLAALNALPPELRVFREMVPIDTLRAQAHESCERYRQGRALSVFDGVPVALKDMVYLQGVNCTCGSDPAHGTGTEVKDDTVVAKLKAKGAIVLGLTVMTEFGVTPLGYSLHSQAPVNPYDASHYSGGSSSSSALGAALGIFPVALGFDGGGSIRIPAAMQGIFGLKCTWGRVPVDNYYCENNVSSGPMAGSAADLALFYEVVAQPDAQHFYQSLHGVTPLPPPHYALFNRCTDLSDMRLGVFDAWFDDCVPEVRVRAREVLGYLQSLGAQVVPVEIPNLEVMTLSHALSISTDFTTSHEQIFWEHPESLEPSTRIQLALGGEISGVEFLSTCWVRGWAVSYMQELFQEKQLSGVITPTIATLPPVMPVAARSTGESNSACIVELLKFIFLGNFCGLPAVSMPAGLSKEGLPIGMQLLAGAWDEHICLRVANAMDVPQFRTTPPRFVDLLANQSS